MSTLTWSAVSGATSYSVKYGTVTGVYGTPVSVGNVTTHTLSGLTNGKPYFIVVTANNAAGTSAHSNEKSVTPQAPIPIAPVLSTATAGNAQATLTWVAVSGATSYSVKYGTSTGVYGSPVIVGNVTTHTLSGLTNGKPYFIVVTANNVAGSSANSNEKSVTPLAAIPLAPVLNTATAGNAQATLTWAAVSGATSYSVKYGTSTGVYGSPVIVGNVTTHTLSGLTNGKPYFIVVTANNVAGTSANSNEKSVTPLAPIPIAPVLYTAIPDNRLVNLSWSLVSGATSYTIKYGTSSGIYGVPVSVGYSSKFQITGLLNGTKYYFVVNAVNASGTSINSNQLSVTVNPQIAPTISVTAPVNNSVYLVPARITFNVLAAATTATISKVEFFNGTALLGTTTSSPYSYIANFLSAGTYTIMAKVTDSFGASKISSPVIIKVHALPTVTIVSPVNQSVLTTGSVNVTARVEGDISKVSFYNGATLLGTVNSSSSVFTYTWTNVPSGVYNLTASGTDSFGTTKVSLPVKVTVNALPFTKAINNNVLSKTDALSRKSTYEYDKLNRLLKTTFPDASSISFKYDLFGNQISVTDQRGNIVTKVYDAYERLSQVKDPIGGITQFNYDTEGRLLRIIDAKGRQITYTYDANGRVLTNTNALNYSTVFTYDLVGNVLTKKEANGKVLSYTYDRLNRLLTTKYPDATEVMNGYDVLGRRVSMTDSIGQTTYIYDSLSRLSEKIGPGINNTVTYSYDSEDNLLTTSDQNNNLKTNTYDKLNRLVSVSDSNGTTSYAYDAVSNKIQVAMPNGVTEKYTYDTLDRITSAINTKSATVISSFSNVYDQAGMITKKTLSDGSWIAYTYDALNRLIKETKQTSSSIIYDYAYTYDALGNRLSWIKKTTLAGFWSVDSLTMPPLVLTNITNAGFGTTANQSQLVSLVLSYNYDNANRLSNWTHTINIGSSAFPVETNTYVYDNNGNRISKQKLRKGQESTPQQTAYTYDFENQLNRLQYLNIPGIPGSQVDSFTYNGDGLRTQAVLNNITSKYLYDGMNVIVERDGANAATKSYTRGLDFGGGIGSIIAQKTVSTGVVQYYDYDDLGSVADLTTSTGTAASKYSYDAFGNLLTPLAVGDTNRFLFSLKEYDLRSGLYYFGARYYDPEIGRWLSPDPLGYVDGLNLYAYVNNNPVNYVDPHGYMSVIPGDPIILPPFPPVPGPNVALPKIPPVKNSGLEKASDIRDNGDLFNKKQDEDHKKGGKKSSRDRDFGIQDRKFWKDWERYKQKTGSPDIESTGEARNWYDQWRQGPLW